MKLTIIASAIILTAATTAFAKQPDYGYIPNTENQLWGQLGWPGEYPGPGLKLSQKMTFKAQAKLTDAFSGSNVKPKKCTYAAGNYHPWAQKTKATYASISKITMYTASAETSVSYSAMDSVEEKTINLKVGDKLKELAYLAEGSCVIEVDGKPAVAQCLGMDEKLKADANTSSDYYADQAGDYILAACSGKGESGSAWIKVDRALFQVDGIDEVEITGYGSIKE